MAVFGSCYCAISNLEIKDGDICMMLPLDFCIETNFARDTGLENAFYVPFRFSGKPEKVRFGGNFSVIEYIGNGEIDSPEWKKANRDFEREKSSFFMLVHLQFYETLVSDYSKDYDFGLRDCRVVGISNRLIEDVDRHNDWVKMQYSFKAKNATTDEEKEKFINLSFQDVVPEWLVALAKITRFMSSMGKRPAPNDANDQHEHGKMLIEYIKSAKKLKNKYSP